MANTLRLKRRIKTAQNVSKTTRAMQMIAASKLKRAQAAALSSRPYVEKLTLLSNNLTAKIDKDSLHPYMKPGKSDKELLIIISPDKGLCGGLVTNLIKEYLTLKTKDLILLTIGKKAQSYVLHTRQEIIASFPFGTTLPSFDVVYPIIKIINDHFLEAGVGSVKILTSHFTSIFSQKPVITTLLPITLPPETEKSSNVLLFEPNIAEILPDLLKHYLEMTLYQYLLEGYLSEQAARMFAMQNATDNAKDMIEELTLEYNKARQEKITSEILDISSVSFFAYAQE
ncbi:MAG: ATP synthase F1 subunit gamma [Candidatus Levybacteria bacterium]|nr:ATP synthase F1 subunit gamma [Candidatus Levybacteria bacterium]MBI2189966.1 ATP synthase F1 subunit gamma [Candidatus Levybacteria bacterium]MBI3069890.1 ATP synthase F1 subunit gamma [Candidatus Levybacteria bacterium]